jgi:two-component system sensor histidine kinase TctE
MQHSLARRLLSFLLPVGLLLSAAGSLIAYQVAHRSATVAYDRALLDAAQSIATQVRLVDDKIELQIANATEQVLLYDNLDRVFYAVYDQRGESIAGTPGLPRPATLDDRAESHFFDGLYSGQQVRGALLIGHRGSAAFSIVVVETLVKRDRLAREILLAMLVPELLLVFITVVATVSAIGAGLKGIGPVREALASRSHADLSPIPLHHVPAELRPLIADTNDLLQRLSFSLDRHRHLIADASHQLRTPIAALRTEAETALKTGEAAAAMPRIAAAARQLARLSHNVLMLNRLEPGYLADPQPIDLADLIRSAADRWLPDAMRNDIDLGFDLAPAIVHGEPVWLEELVHNLVDNALRHTPAGGTVTVRCNADDGGGLLEVEDSGPGIPVAERERIFERFYRAHPESGDGSGLGLAIVREVANAHRAIVVVSDSRELGGARVQVRFPV